MIDIVRKWVGKISGKLKFPCNLRVDFIEKRKLTE